ncbi:MAG: phosphoglucomutase/phosphomannomutase family protein [Candidatus Marinimicrobia bacterium]|nr:phosphoglucomutase/phosphomannomutase family protein [Candidatus Neomarinimicrobiota bacterium]
MKNIYEHIKFGTDGWRAVIAKEFTFDNVAIIAQAIADYLNFEKIENPSVALGYDTRFMSKMFAEKIAQILASNGVSTVLSHAFIPTPVLSFAVKNNNLSAGVMVTASHNPCIYNGVKFKGPYGGSAMVELTQSIESYLGKNPIKESGQTEVKIIDMFEAYQKHLATLVDVEAIRSLNKKIAFSAMYGAGCGYLDKILWGGKLEILSIQNEPRPDFNQILPEPIAQNLSELIQIVKNSDCIAGFATDGDGDRFGVLDETGEFVQLHDLMPILFEYLVKTRNLPGNIVRTTSMSNTIDKIAAKYHRKVFEVPVGFKNICEKMLQEDILIGGEESGGFGYKNHVPERDGLLSLLLVLEMLAKEDVPLSRKVKKLRNEFGPFHYKRIDRHCNVHHTRKNLENLIQFTPESIAGFAIENINTIDGLKVYFQNGCWMLVRLSDTEPLFRVYVGGNDEQAVNAIIFDAEMILTNSWGY